MGISDRHRRPDRRYPRAIGFFAYVALIEAARRITVPVQFLLPRDEQYVDRQPMLALFDAFASKDKTLLANSGTHRSMRRHATTFVELVLGDLD